ncbi:MAG: hypothetical protein U0470_01445 [Anaerolineae bacterium]
MTPRNSRTLASVADGPQRPVGASATARTAWACGTSGLRRRMRCGTESIGTVIRARNAPDASVRADPASLSPPTDEIQTMRTGLSGGNAAPRTSSPAPSGAQGGSATTLGPPAAAMPVRTPADASPAAHGVFTRTRASVAVTLCATRSGATSPPNRGETYRQRAANSPTSARRAARPTA